MSPEPKPPRRSASDLRLQDTLRLSAQGIAKILGDLETRVMHVVWELDHAASARTVHERVARDHPVAIHTVITVLNNLVAKGLLRRQKQNDVLHFEACVTEEEFRREISRRAVEGILSLGSRAIAASFVDVLAERDPEDLALLMRLIQERTQQEDG